MKTSTATFPTCLTPAAIILLLSGAVVSSAPSSGTPSAVQHLQPLCRGDHHQLIRGPVWKMLCLLGMAHCPGPPTGASGLLGQQPPPQAQHYVCALAPTCTTHALAPSFHLLTLRCSTTCTATSYTNSTVCSDRYDCTKLGPGSFSCCHELHRTGQ